MRHQCYQLLVVSVIVFWLMTAHAIVLNNPYPDSQSNQNIYYTSFSESPKTLDPARSYAANEYQFINQIYEPVLQYDYLARPYQLIPQTAVAMPLVRYFDKLGNEIKEADKERLEYTTYTVSIQPGILYQPHPAFAKNKEGQWIYNHLSADYLDEHDINQLSDFKQLGTRELVADDYIYQIKRLANPALNSPIYGLMSEHIIGFHEFAKQLPSQKNAFLDLRPYDLKGVKKIDQYTFEISIKGHYPQFLYWLAMPFFSPVPWEADQFYSQPDMDDRNLSLGWYPIGTGPFFLSENNPNSQMILQKNPNYRPTFFPSQSSEEDRQKGYLHHAGARLPLIDKAIYTLEKESIPRWNKFLQGYYDLSGVSADSFEQAIRITPTGDAQLTPAMQQKGLWLTQMDEAAVYYLGFNMLDPIVGGYSEKAKKLRQAISIAINYEENIAIFLNGRGQAAQGPIPPGIFGYQAGKAGLNPYTHFWKNGHITRLPIERAKQLMREAGYAHGIDPKTKRPLILHYDVQSSGGPDDKAQLNWMRKQLARIGISLDIRATQYNRFQEKMRSGNAQLFTWAWLADYPDPENFLFLLYGPNGKVKFGGENTANYENKAFDALFVAMKNHKNDTIRQQIINKMLRIVREDAPWVWGINPQSLVLSQQWIAPVKPNTIANNTLKYMAIDVPLRALRRYEWNQAVLWPIGLFIGCLLVFLFPFLMAYIKKLRQQAPRLNS